MFHKQHCLCLRGHSTDRKLYAHPLFILPTEITQIICLEGHRCLKSVMHVSHANEPGTWGGGGGVGLCLTWERGEKRLPARAVWGSSCISMQCLVYSPGVIKGLDFLCLLVDSYVVYTQEPLNSLKLCIKKCGLLFFSPPPQAYPDYFALNYYPW